MLLAVHRPAPPLSAFIEDVIYHSGFMTPHTKECMLPDQNTYIIIDLSEQPKHVYDDVNPGRKTAYRRGWVSGVKTEPIIFDASNRATMLVIRFKAGGAAPFFDFPMHLLYNRVVELEDVWPKTFTALRERLLHCPTPEQVFRVLDTAFLQLAKERLVLHPCVNYAATALQSSPYDVAISQLQKKAGYSHKHFIRLFEQHIGLTPKRFSRLIRFQKVLHHLDQLTGPLEWVQVALAAGYYDQAHFIKEFKFFSGLSPTRYMREKGEFLGYIPID